jgi:branched-chain amino acid transport system permease protein
LLGVLPLTLLFEVLGAQFPNAFSIVLGGVFMLIVYAVPHGVAGWVEGAALQVRSLRRSPA